jgi:hypothetical protein
VKDGSDGRDGEGRKEGWKEERQVMVATDSREKGVTEGTWGVNNAKDR